MRAKVVDLFCGIGGLSYAFLKEGFAVQAGVDSDSSCKFAFESNVNARFLAKDLRDVKGSEVGELFKTKKGEYRVLIGCAPCTPFSTYTGRYSGTSAKTLAGKWQLLREFSRIVEATRPHVVTMENVPRLKKHTVFRQFVNKLKECGYTVTHRKVRASVYGVPQRRTRLVLFATLLGRPITMVRATHSNPVTVRQAIGHLPAIAAGESATRDRLHKCRGLSSTNLRRLRATVQGGGWQDWDPNLQLECHKKASGATFRGVYGRMKWDAVGPVITTQCLGIGNGRFGHPEQDRAISIREAALLQTFPKSFRFVQPRGKVIGATLARQIGNAVPVALGRAIARSIKCHLLAGPAPHP